MVLLDYLYNITQGHRDYKGFIVKEMSRTVNNRKLAFNADSFSTH